ncbi:hypothetical protein GJ700_26290 [Duganella sp. FT92W]|uniref:Uncharacterized protein n=1 Tax=Pseudoduganella rivuli TaxID=2666085 RepID=A0A7X2ISD7_9BURK|nr:hypothetical protein [Pseudoduganella rivuli]MRV75231.1 hypothetical protein [Pseudoduganella rivuli]
MDQPAYSLTIRSPAPMRAGAIGVSLFGAAVVLTSWINHPERWFVLQPGALFNLGIALLMLLLLGCILYRNLFGTEVLTLVKHGAEISATDGAIIDCRELTAIRLLPSPDLHSFDGKMAWLGIDDGRLLLVTRIGKVRFGSGLSERAAVDVFRQIEAFRRTA